MGLIEQHHAEGRQAPGREEGLDARRGTSLTVEDERQRTAREQWCSTTLESIGDGVIATDPGERITFMNAVAEHLTGWSRDEARGRSLADVLRLVDGAGAPIPCPVTRAMAERKVEKLPRNTSLVARSGAKLRVGDSTTPILDAQDVLLGGVVIFRDLTESVRMEERVTQSECLAAIGTMSAGMAHEINNPLTYVMGNIALSLEQLTPTLAALCDLPVPAADQGRLSGALAGLREVQQMLEEAAAGAERVRRIVHDLKKFTRVDATTHALVDLHGVLETAAKMTANACRHRARVRVEYGPTPRVMADGGQLTQVFTNLLSNAAEAIADGDADHHEIRIVTRTDEGGRAVVEIHDTGSGIPREVIARVFDPFFSTKTPRSGMGLGLAICRNLLNRFGGEIRAESVPGSGSTFRVTLPAACPEATAASASSDEATVGRRGRVLIVDDEPAVARSVARVLGAEHDVTIVLDGRSAIARLAGGETYDVIFCDLMMPNITGAELHGAVERTNPEQARRFVFMTGGAFSEAARAFLATTSNVHIEKPLSIKALRSIARDYTRAATCAALPLH